MKKINLVLIDKHINKFGEMYEGDWDKLSFDEKESKLYKEGNINTIFKLDKNLNNVDSIFLIEHENENLEEWILDKEKTEINEKFINCLPNEISPDIETESDEYKIIIAAHWGNRHEEAYKDYIESINKKLEKCNNGKFTISYFGSLLTKDIEYRTPGNDIVEKIICWSKTAIHSIDQIIHYYDKQKEDLENLIAVKDKIISEHTCDAQKNIVNELIQKFLNQVKELEVTYNNLQNELKIK